MDTGEILNTLIREMKAHQTFSDSEKREVFDRLVRIETKIESVGCYIDGLPCKNNSDRIAKLYTKIETTKYAITMSLLAFLLSAATIVVSIVSVVKTTV